MDEKSLHIDNELTAKLKKGDIKAFETVFHRYKSQLYYFSMAYLKSGSESEEVVQNAFLSLWEYRESLIDSLSVKNYLFRIVTNNIYNHIKHLAVKRKYADFAELHLSDEDNNTQQQLDFTDLENNIESLVCKLPEQTQKVFRLSRIEGLSHHQIATELGISVRTVENLIYRALKFIKENLKNEHLIVLFIISVFW